MPPTFHCSVVTPERAVLETEARFVALPAHDGEIGILPDRAPLLIRLGVGRLRVQSGSAEEVMVVDGGFAEMAGNRLTVLTEQAWRPEEIDREQARRALAEAREMSMADDDDFVERQRSMARARALLAAHGAGGSPRTG